MVFRATGSTVILSATLLMTALSHVAGPVAAAPTSGIASTAGPASMALGRPAINLHARFWSIPGWAPQAGDYGYILFTPGLQPVSDVLQGLAGVPPAHRMLVTTSIAGLEATLAELYDGRGFTLGAVGYDLEGWSRTPPEEQADPASACDRGRALAARYGLPFMVGPTASFSDRWGTRMAPHADSYQSQDKARQAEDWNLAVQHQRALYRALTSANPLLRFWHDMAVSPKGLEKPLEDLLDYYYAMSDMVDGIGIWAMGRDTAMLQKFLLTVRPGPAPVPGDRAPVIQLGASASPPNPDLNEVVSLSVTATDPDGDPLAFTWDPGDHSDWGDGRRLSRGELVHYRYDRPGTYVARVTVTDGRGGVASFSVTVNVGNGAPQDPPDLTAVFDPVLGAPLCPGVGRSCDSGSLLDGRDGKGPEPHSPNTLDRWCPDGSAGTYHVDESNDRLRVATLDGAAFAAGKLVRIDATVWAWTKPNLDRLDLYYTVDASQPSWIYITSLTPSRPGSQVLSATYTLPAGPLQAVRARFLYAGSGTTCGSGSYNDRDDIAFAVQ